MNDSYPSSSKGHGKCIGKGVLEPKYLHNLRIHEFLPLIRSMEEELRYWKVSKW